MPAGINFELNPVFNAGSFNSIISEIKAALGPLGKDIRPIDETKFTQGLKEYDNLIKKVDDDTKKLGDDTTKTGGKVKQSVDEMKKSLATMMMAGKQGTQEFANLRNKVVETEKELIKSQKEADKFKEAMMKVGKDIESQTQGRGILGKVFQVNQINQLATDFAGKINKLQEPLIELDQKSRFIGTLGVKNWKDFQTAALDAGMTSGANFQGLIDATYDAISAGAIKVTNGVADIEGGMKFLKESGKLAKVGMLDTQTTVNALTGVMNAYGASYADTAKYTDTFTAAAQLGKTTIAELSGTLYNVVPAAASAGISFEQVVAAVATMTKQGVPTAQATTQIRQGIIELMKPGSQLSVVMQKAGVSINSLKAEGFQTSMVKVGKAMQDMGLKANQVFSSVEAANAANLMMTKTAEGTSMAMSDLSYMMTQTSGATQAGYEIMSESIESRTKRVENRIKAFMATLADSMGPEMNAIFQQTTKAAPMITTFANLKTLLPEAPFAKAKEMILGLGAPFATLGKSLAGFGTRITTALIPSFASAAAAGVSSGAAIAAAWLPIIAIVAGVAALGVGLYALAGGFKKSAEEKLKDAESDVIAIENKKKLNLQQQETAKNNITLIKSYEDLGKKGLNRTAEESRQFYNIQEKLNQQYPGVIKKGQSFEENLKGIKNATGLQNAELSKYNEKNQKLVLQYEQLGKKMEEYKKAGKDTTEIQKEYQNVIQQLNAEYPGVIDNTKSFADNLHNLQIRAGMTSGEIERLRKEFQMLDKESQMTETKKSYAQVGVEVKKLYDIVDKNKGTLEKTAEVINKITSFGISGESDISNQIKDAIDKYTDAMYNAKDDANLKAAAKVFKNALWNSTEFQGLSNESKNQMDAQIKKVAQEITEKLLKFKPAQATANKKELEQMVKDLKYFQGQVNEIGNQVDAGTITKTQLQGQAKAIKDQMQQAVNDKKLSTEDMKKLDKQLFQLQMKLKADYRGTSNKDEKESQQKLNDDLLKMQNDLEEKKAKLASASIKDKNKREIAEMEKNNLKELNTLEEQQKKIDDELAKTKDEKQKNALEEQRKILAENVEVTKQIQLEAWIDLYKKQIEEQEKANNDILKNESELVKKRLEFQNSILPSLSGSAYPAKLQEISNLNVDILRKEGEQKVQEYLKQNKDYENALDNLALAQARLNAPMANPLVDLPLAQEAVNLAEKNLETIKNNVLKTDEFIMITNKQTEQAISDEQRKNQLEIQEFNLKSIENGAIRERELRIFEARKTYNEELKLARGNQSLEMDAFIKFQEAKFLAEQDYLNRVSSLYTASQTLKNDLMAFHPDLSAKKASDERKAQLQDELKSLKRQLDDGQVSREEYYKKRRDLEQQIADETVDINKLMWKQLEQTVIDSLKKINDYQVQQARILGDKLMMLNIDTAKNKAKGDEAASKAMHSLSKGNIKDYEKYSEQIVEIDNENLKNAETAADVKKELMYQTGAAMITTFMTVAMEEKKYLKAGFLALIQGLKAMAPVYIGEAIMKSFAKDPVLGAVIAGFATGAIYGGLSMIEGAASQLTFNKGGYTGNYGVDEPTGVVHGQEFVHTAANTSKNLADFMMIHSQDLTIEEHIRRNRPDIQKKLISDVISNYKFTEDTPVSIYRGQPDEVSQFAMLADYLDTIQFSSDNSKVEHLLENLLYRMESVEHELKLNNRHNKELVEVNRSLKTINLKGKITADSDKIIAEFSKTESKNLMRRGS